MSDPIGGTHGQPPEDAERPALPTFAPGDAIPNLSSWLLERKLGSGGFGEVWLAKHAWNVKEKPRAVKFCTDPEARHRLVTHEKNVVLRVMKYAGDHPNIVPLLDCNLDGEIPWLMYEFVEGRTLAGKIKRWRKWPLPKRLGRVAVALHAIAGALARCHQLDPPLVHRDLKPHNVLMAVVEGGLSVPRITDFGIGGVAAQPRTDGADDRLTALAARVPTKLQTSGTRMYAPPEQLLGAPPSPRDDVYALGVIAYQALQGDLEVVPSSDVEDELRDLKIPHELVALIVRSVAVNPDRRPRDAAEWESALGAILAQVHKLPDSAGEDDSGFDPAVTPAPAPPSSVRTSPRPIPPEMRPANKPATEPAPASAPPTATRLRTILLGALALVLVLLVLLLVFRK